MMTFYIITSICVSMIIYNACGIILECINRSKNKDPEISATQIAEITREFRINQCTRLEQQPSEQSMRNKQSIYKVDGDFNGDIKGDNVTVILMGDGDVNGNIESNDGNVVLIKGNINGDIKANKVLMPNKKRDIYFGRKGIVVRCPMCNELYTQSLSINGNTSEDGMNLMLDVKIDVEKPFRHKCVCESCRYYVNGGINHYWCTQGDVIRRCIKNGAIICKYYEGKNDH